MQNIAVVVAAGYGSFQMDGPDYVRFPKILERVDGEPMIVRVIRKVQAAGFDACVVGNPHSTPWIQMACSDFGIAAHFETQPARTGSADAVLECLPWLRKMGNSSFLMIYADMPLWSVTTICALVDVHNANPRATISMVTTIRSTAYPELDRYGRIIRDDRGRIVRVVEPANATPEELLVEDVNPSLMIFSRQWFEDNVGKVEPVVRTDGRESERYLPPLINLAHQDERLILEVPLWQPWEALGVNTKEELHLVRRVCSRTASLL